MQPGGTKRPPFISPLPSPLLPSYFYTLHIFATTKQDWLCCYTLLFFPSRFLPPLPTSLSFVRRPWNSPHLAKIKEVYRKKKRDEELFLSNSGKTPRSMVSNGKMHKRLFLVFSLCLSAKEKRTKSAREKRLTASRCLLVRRECSPNSSSSRRRSIQHSFQNGKQRNGEGRCILMRLFPPRLIPY